MLFVTQKFNKVLTSTQVDNFHTQNSNVTTLVNNQNLNKKENLHETTFQDF